jgi:hypothetical protein
MFDHQDYNQQYLQNIAAGNPPINDAAEQYGVGIRQAIIPEGQEYWRIIGVHHLLPDENMGNHNLFVDALNENGIRVPPPLYAGWTWEGRRDDEIARPGLLDKPLNEPATNFAMSFGQIISVWILGPTEDSKDLSDTIYNVHTNHSDEPTPDGSPQNSIGHHSFYVVFQRTKGAAPPDPEPPTPSPKPINQYILVGPTNPEVDLFLVTDFALFLSGTIGFSTDEAKLAKNVMIIGQGISQSTINEIRDSGSEVEVLAGDAYNIRRILKERVEGITPVSQGTTTIPDVKPFTAQTRIRSNLDLHQTHSQQISWKDWLRKVWFR